VRGGYARGRRQEVLEGLCVGERETEPGSGQTASRPLFQVASVLSEEKRPHACIEVEKSYPTS